MNLEQLYKYINFITNKEQIGDPATPDSFNLLLEYYNSELYNELYNDFVQAITSDEPQRVADILTDGHPLKYFEKHSEYYYKDKAMPEIPKPKDYGHYISLAVYLGGKFRNVEILNTIRYVNRIRNVLAKPIYEYPIGMELPDGIQITPNNLNKFELYYFRKVETPYFDYCIDQGDNVIYMPPGSSLVNTGDTVNLINESGTVLTANVILPKNSTYPYKSKSKELDWNEPGKKMVTDKIISAILTRSREAVPTKQ